MTPHELLTQSLRRLKTDADVYHDLMAFRVREILLVAPVYDAFVLEEEDRLTEQIFGEYHQLSLSSAPRITSVSSGAEALRELERRNFDMAVLTTRVDEGAPLDLARRIRDSHPSLPVLLLLKDSSENRLLAGRDGELDGVFVWNGDAKVFLAMINLVEDRANLATDTAIGLVRVILLVEDSTRAYSSILPVLYSEIMKQTQALIDEERLNEAKKLLRMRTRPKVLLARAYDEAEAILRQHTEHLLCLISDVAFPARQGGEIDERAGVRLIAAARALVPDLPILVQSSETSHAQTAAAVGAEFLDKNGANLSGELTRFVLERLGFGDFVFRDGAGSPIGRARSLQELRELLLSVDDESLIYHARRNHFSAWLMARGEIRIAREVHPIKVSDFATTAAMRAHLVGVVDQADRTLGRVVAFEDAPPDARGAVLRVASGSLGGRGRGIAFLHLLLQGCRLDRMVDGLILEVPRTAVIGTEEYTRFVESNGLADLFGAGASPAAAAARFAAAALSPSLRERLRRLVGDWRDPVSVRSSGLFEDSAAQPWAEQTILLANSSPDPERRLAAVEAAIKRVYASVLSDEAAACYRAIGSRSDEDRMAVLLQAVPGSRRGDTWYPVLSGVAASQDYYAPAGALPQDGVATVCLGLCRYLSERKPGFRFSPRLPRADLISPEELLRESQREIYALDLERPEEPLARLTLADARAHGTLRLCVSTWDRANATLHPGDSGPGASVVTFAPILKYDELPLADALARLLDLLQAATGNPVEVEFALDLDGGHPPRLSLMQVRPVGRTEGADAELADTDRTRLLMRSERARGNGRIADLRDVVFAEPRRPDRDSVAMGRELAGINRALAAEGRRYLLIGPGRWGSRDPSLGIPVRWEDISAAAVLVETDLADYKPDPSFGSHFLQQITSMGLGYLSVEWGSAASFVDWEWLASRTPLCRSEHFAQLRFERPFEVLIDGRSSRAVVRKPA